MQKYEQVLRTKKQILFYNFIGGISWGLGATIGVSIILTILAALASQLHIIPVFGDFFGQIAKHAAQTTFR